MSAPHTNRTPSTLASLRALMPDRALSTAESLRVAELQAARLLELSGITTPAMPESVIAELPRIKLRRLSPLPMSGYTAWSKGHWVIALNGAESATRQRFSLAHEFKHILDHPFIDASYGRLPGSAEQQWAERLCDYFAACLLMPKAWVKHYYCNEGVQDLVGGHAVCTWAGVSGWRRVGGR